MIRLSLLEYGAAYVNFDYQYPKEGGFKVGAYPLKLDFSYTNLVHDPISFDMNRVEFNFTKFIEPTRNN
jgi:hypothetical protein